MVDAASLIAGFQSLLSLDVLIALIAGTVGGMVIGALPGFSAAMGVSLLIPITYGMSPVAALTMLVAMYTSAIYGGSITAILCHTPGTPASAATAIDGYQLTKQGRGMEAMGVATLGSAVGGTVSAIAMLLIAPALGAFSLKFSVLEYFLLAVFGLTVIASLAGESLIKGLFSGVLGLLLGCVGLDAISGYPRMTMGLVQLEDGINFVPALIGLFSVAQVMTLAYDVHHGKSGSVIEDEENLKKGRALPPWSELKTLVPTMVRCSLVGTLVGIVPAAGAGVSSWICYSMGKKFSKHPEKFGHGSPEGIAGSEAANNAIAGGAFVPLLALGIPGDAGTAVMMGALTMQGIVFGPSLFTEEPGKAYIVFIALFVANILMGICGFSMIRVFGKVIDVPNKYLVPVIMTFCITGTFALNHYLEEVFLMLIMGVIGFVLIKLDFAMPPIILGLVLGSLAEKNARRSIDLLGSSETIWQHPIAIIFIVLAIASLVSPAISAAIKKRKAAKAAAAEEN